MPYDEPYDDDMLEEDDLPCMTPWIARMRQR